MPRPYTRRLGQLGERMAAQYLCSQGYWILETNARSSLGEIDIVAQEGDILAFVEVRTRRGSAFGTPEESITARKRQKLRELAEDYRQTHPQAPAAYRIDVVVVELTSGGKMQRVELIRGAVGEE